MSAQQTMRPRLSSAQRFVLKDMQDCTSFVWLNGHYAKTRYTLLRKGLIVFNERRGKYELTEAGRVAFREATKCSPGCMCVNCFADACSAEMDLPPRQDPPLQTALGAAIAKATGAAS